MSEYSTQLHAGCVGHVSIAKGLVYCPHTEIFYFSAAHFRAGGSVNRGYEPWDFQVLESSLMTAQRRWPWVRPRGIVLLRNDQEMPGLDGSGLNPNQTSPFKEKPK